MIWLCNPTPGHGSGEKHNQKVKCTSVFIATLFMIAKTWKQPECLSTEEGLKKMWCIHTMEYYSAIQKNEAT